MTSSSATCDFRRGSTDAGDRNDSIGGNPIGNVMIDHVSASWGIGREHVHVPAHVSTAARRPRSQIAHGEHHHSTFDLSEALNTYHHAFGSTIGGLNSSFHHNLWACNTGRNPSVGMYGDFTFANNVIFNYRHRTIDGGDHRSQFNIINNYFKPGPGTPQTAVAYRILKPESERSKTVVDNFGKAYVTGNFVEGYPKVSADNWAGGVQPESRAPVDSVLPSIRSEQPFPHAAAAHRARQDCLHSSAGRRWCDTPRRDAVDVRVIEMVRTGQVAKATVSPESLTKAAAVKYAPQYVEELAESVKLGYITDPNEVGGYPTYTGSPYTDSDQDGLPDSWESQRRLNSNDPQDATLDSDD